jgi:hypothetical protein
MKTMSKQITTAALLALGIGFSGAAFAQSTWDLSTSSCDPYGTPPGAAGCTVGNVTATVTAWGNSGSAGQFVAATISDQGTSGVGITSSYGGKTEYTGDGLNHAIDNYGGARNSSTSYGAYTELLMVGFSEATRLDGLSIGWRSGDADISVLRWTGEDPPDLTKMTSTGTGGLIAKGWELVSSYDLYSSYSTSVSSAGYSSWWLISAYFGNSTTTSKGADLDTGDDFFKLKTFSGTGCKTTNSCGGGGSGSVPEPGTLALAGLALAGIVGAKRRRARTV